MFAGRVGSWERLQYRVRIEPTMQVTEEESVSGVLTVPFAPDLDSLTEFLKLTIALSVDNQGNITRTVTIVFGNTTWMRTDENVTASAQELILEFESPRWYVLNMPAWEFRWSGLRVYLNGSEVAHTLPTAGIVRNEYYFAPAGLPMSLAFLNGSAHAGIGIETPIDCLTSMLAETRVRVIGGWRIRETPTSDWTAFPIRVQSADWHGDPCHNLTPEYPELSGSDTWNATISSFIRVSVLHIDLGYSACICYCPNGVPYRYIPVHLFKQTSTIHSHESSVWIVPDLPRRFIALGSVPHEYLMYRDKFPQVGVQRIWNGSHLEGLCPNQSVFICDVNNADNPDLVVLHTSRDELLSVHDGSENNPLNEPTGEPLYCPYAATVWYDKREQGAACPIEEPLTCPVPDPDICGDGGGPLLIIAPCCPFEGNLHFRELIYGETHTWSVDHNCHPYYDHAHNAVRYWNTHAAPFWSYICWLQDWLLDRNGDGVAEPTPLADYWRPHQCQHIEHPALPSGVRTRRRSYLLLDALVHGTWSGWIDALFGIPSGWVGSTRPALVEWLLPSEVTLTAESAPRWNATNATLAFGAGGISVTPTSTTHTLEFTLADWGTEPYLYPAVADRVRIWLPDTAYTSISIELVSAENETVPIATTRGTHSIPHGNDTKYAGTWARQYAAFAAGYSEIGSDWDSDGVSSATFGDPTRATLWQLLGARAGAKLRITVTQSTPTPYLLSYPTFYRDTETEVIATDNGAHTFPHVRNLQTLNWGLLEYPIAGNTPSLRDPHEPMTLYDAAALFRQLELGLDASATIDIIDQIRAWGIDDVETGGHPAGVVRVRQMCRAAMLPYIIAKLALWLINDLRECPALPTLPTRRFQLTPAFGFTGDWGQWCYFAAPARRYYLAPNENAHLWEIDGTSETQRTNPDRTIGRFLITHLDLSLDGTETLQHPSKQWRIRVGDRTLARTTPFFSHALIPPRIPPTFTRLAPLTVSHRRDRLYFALQPNTLEYTATPTLRARTTRNTPRNIHALETNDRTDLPQLAIGYQQDDTVTFAILAGDGTIVEGWTMPGKRILIQSWGEEYALYAWILGTDNLVRMRVSRDHAATWTPATDCILDGLPFTADDIGDCTLDRRHHTLYITYKRDDTVAIARSTDGINWETSLT